MQPIKCLALLFGLVLAAVSAGPAQIDNLGERISHPRVESRVALARFESWQQRYGAEPDSKARMLMLAQGVVLAKERRIAMRELIQVEPDGALTAAIPGSQRMNLPVSIANELEVEVAGIGDLLVLCAMPPLDAKEVEPIRKLARIGGRTYRAFGYGRRLIETTQRGILLQGVAIDGVLALQGGTLPEANHPQVAPANPPVQKKVLVIRVDFSDLPGDPRPPGGSTPLTAATVQTLADSQIGAYYQKSSYGRSTLSFTVTSQLYRLPRTAVDYATISLEFALYADAQAAAKADYDLAAYDVVVVLFSWLGSIPGSQLQFAGLTMVDTPMVWVNGEFDFRVVAHELGHSYGLYHANLWESSDANPVGDNGTSAEYADPFDTMGANWHNDGRTDFNPWFKNQLKWITDDQIQSITTSGIYRVYRFDAASATGVLALKIVKDAERNYWVGCRRSFIENPAMQHGAYVVWGYNWPHQSDLVNMGTPANAAQNAALPIGAALADFEASLTIFPVTEGGETPADYLDVQVSFGPPPFVNSQPQAAAVFEGQDAQFSVAAAGYPAPGFLWQRKARGSSDWADLSDGASVSGSSTSTLVVHAAGASMSGDSFRCLLTNAAGGFNCSQPVVLTVPPPNPPSLQMSVVAGQIILSWPASAVGFGLEATSALSGVGAWAPVTNQVALIGSSFLVTNIAIQPIEFFRLHKR